MPTTSTRWHRDKNPGNREEATEKFKEVQNAHAVLSDPQERSWYDNHKDQILRGESDDEDESAGKGPNLDEYLSTQCYSGFNDLSPKGFWQVYSALFAQLEEDEERCESADKYHVPAPEFGNSESSFKRSARQDQAGLCKKSFLLFQQVPHTASVKQRCSLLSTLGQFCHEKRFFLGRSI